MSFSSDLIQRHEGMRLHVYLDTKGLPTIGAAGVFTIVAGVITGVTCC
jgi:GH24 family phage-related lysozyme (muramidase)